MRFEQLTPTRDSMSELLDALQQREVAVFGHSTPGQTRTPNEGNGTPKRNFFFGNLSVYASRISIADRGAATNRGSWSSRSSSTAAEAAAHSSSSTAAATQQQQHSSSSTAAVVAATSSCCFWSQHPGTNQNAK